MLAALAYLSAKDIIKGFESLLVSHFKVFQKVAVSKVRRINAGADFSCKKTEIETRLETRGSFC